jgi:hypothetical protein
VPDPDESDLTPEELEVRRLLADARHDEPMPADVAARLDRVLADLGDTPAPSPHPLRDHDAARRRRHRRNLVLAAAAVVVLGFGASRLDLSSTDDADSAGSSAADSSTSQEQSEAGGRAGDAPMAQAPSPTPLRLDSGAFERQVERYADQRKLAKDADLGAAVEAAPYDDFAAPTCSLGDVGRGRQVAARYDGQPAVLVVRPASGGERQVDLFLCGTDEPLRSTTVPAG